MCFAASKFVRSSDNDEVVEAESILWALELAADPDLTYICVESDCLTLVSKLKKNISIRGELGIILNRIYNLSRLFVCCQWSFTRWEANQVAHYLAGLRPSLTLFSVVISSFPSGISDSSS